MALLLGVIYALNSVVKSQRNSGTWQDLDVFTKYNGEVWTTLCFWIGFIAYTHLSFVIQLLILSGYIKTWLFDYFIEMLFLYGNTYLIYHSVTLTSTRITIFFIMMTHYFKMNSYSKTNRKYRKEYIEKNIPDTSNSD